MNLLLNSTSIIVRTDVRTSMVGIIKKPTGMGHYISCTYGIIYDYGASPSHSYKIYHANIF